MNSVATTGNTFSVELNTLWLQLKSFFGFADGGVPPVGVPSIVGERGPELFIPHQLGTVIPNHTMRALAGSAPGGGRSTVSSSYSSTGEQHFHFHGINSPQEIMRTVAKYAKSTSPQFSFASR